MPVRDTEGDIDLVEEAMESGLSMDDAVAMVAEERRKIQGGPKSFESRTGFTKLSSSAPEILRPEAPSRQQASRSVEDIARSLPYGGARADNSELLTPSESPAELGPLFKRRQVEAGVQPPPVTGPASLASSLAAGSAGLLGAPSQIGQPMVRAEQRAMEEMARVPASAAAGLTGMMAGKFIRGAGTVHGLDEKTRNFLGAMAEQTPTQFVEEAGLGVSPQMGQRVKSHYKATPESLRAITELSPALAAQSVRKVVGAEGVTGKAIEAFHQIGGPLFGAVSTALTPVAAAGDVGLEEAGFSDKPFGARDLLNSGIKVADLALGWKLIPVALAKLPAAAHKMTKWPMVADMVKQTIDAWRQNENLKEMGEAGLSQAMDTVISGALATLIGTDSASGTRKGVSEYLKDRSLRKAVQPRLGELVPPPAAGEVPEKAPDTALKELLAKREAREAYQARQQDQAPAAPQPAPAASQEATPPMQLAAKTVSDIGFKRKLQQREQQAREEERAIDEAYGFGRETPGRQRSLDQAPEYPEDDGFFSTPPEFRRKPQPVPPLQQQAAPPVAEKQAVSLAPLPQEQQTKKATGDDVRKLVATNKDIESRHAGSVAGPAQEIVEFAGRKTLPLRDVEIVDATTLKRDPATYQYKGGSDERGVTGVLAGKTASDFAPENWISSNLIVHERLNGDRYVADGHQKTDYAERLKQETRIALKSPAIVLREAEGWTPSAIRALAAAKNIREGSGDAIDTAKVLRENPGFNVRSLPVTKTEVRHAIGLAKLSDAAFQEVAAGKLPSGQGAAIGELVNDKGQHEQFVKQLQRLAPETDAEAISYIRDLMSFGTAGEADPGQGTMFGSAPELPLLQFRAAVKKRVLNDLIQGRRYLKAAVGGDTSLKRVGYKTVPEEAAKQATENRRIQEYVEQQSSSPGPISDAITDAARRLAAGESLNQIAPDTIERIRELARPAASGVGGGPERVGTDESVRGGDLAGGTAGEAPPVDEAQGSLFGAPEVSARPGGLLPGEAMPESAGREAPQGSFTRPKAAARGPEPAPAPAAASKPLSRDELFRRLRGEKPPTPPPPQAEEPPSGPSTLSKRQERQQPALEHEVRPLRVGEDIRSQRTNERMKVVGEEKVKPLISDEASETVWTLEDEQGQQYKATAAQAGKFAATGKKSGPQGGTGPVIERTYNADDLKNPGNIARVMVPGRELVARFMGPRAYPDFWHPIERAVRRGERAIAPLIKRTMELIKPLSVKERRELGEWMIRAQERKRGGETVSDSELPAKLRAVKRSLEADVTGPAGDLFGIEHRLENYLPQLYERGEEFNFAPSGVKDPHDFFAAKRRTLPAGVQPGEQITDIMTLLDIYLRTGARTRLVEGAVQTVQARLAAVPQEIRAPLEKILQDLLGRKSPDERGAIASNKTYMSVANAIRSFVYGGALGSGTGALTSYLTEKMGASEGAQKWATRVGSIPGGLGSLLVNSAQLTWGAKLAPTGATKEGWNGFLENRRELLREAKESGYVSDDLFSEMAQEILQRAPKSVIQRGAKAIEEWASGVANRELAAFQDEELMMRSIVGVGAKRHAEKFLASSPGDQQVARELKLDMFAGGEKELFMDYMKQIREAKSEQDRQRLRQEFATEYGRSMNALVNIAYGRANQPGWLRSLRQLSPGSAALLGMFVSFPLNSALVTMAGAARLRGSSMGFESMWRGKDVDLKTTAKFADYLYGQAQRGATRGVFDTAGLLLLTAAYAKMIGATSGLVAHAVTGEDESGADIAGRVQFKPMDFAKMGPVGKLLWAVATAAQRWYDPATAQQAMGPVTEASSGLARVVLPSDMREALNWISFHADINQPPPAKDKKQRERQTIPRLIRMYKGLNDHQQADIRRLYGSDWINRLRRGEMPVYSDYNDLLYQRPYWEGLYRSLGLNSEFAATRREIEQRMRLLKAVATDEKKAKTGQLGMLGGMKLKSNLEELE